MKLLAVGPDKDLLKQGSVSYVRHAQYAERCEELRAVVFARRAYGKKPVVIAKNASVHPTNARNVFGLLWNARRIGRALLQEEGDWVISAQDPFESGFIGWLLARETGHPLLIQEHGDFFSAPHWKRESHLNTLRYYFGRWLIKRADHVRVVSKRIQRTLEKMGIPPERVSVAPVYTDVSAFASAQPNEKLEDIKRKGGVIVLSMARFVSQKNLTLLIRSFADVVKDGAQAHLVLVGSGPQQDMLQQRAEECIPGHYTFLDWTDDPAGMIRSADIYALSSNYEGWGRVCIEALAASTPILMTDVGCAGEIVEHEKNGLIVSIGDREAFGASLRQLIQDEELRKRLAGNGKETVKKLPTIEGSLALYVDVLETCLKQKQ